MIKVLLADDADIMRKTISQLLKRCSEVQLVAEANSYAQMERLIAEHHPDIVIMDLHMGDERNVTPQQIKSSLNGCPLLAISIWNDDEAKGLAETYGAAALLDKPLLADELIPAIKQYAKT